MLEMHLWWLTAVNHDFMATRQLLQNLFLTRCDVSLLFVSIRDLLTIKFAKFLAAVPTRKSFLTGLLAFQIGTVTELMTFVGVVMSTL